MPQRPRDARRESVRGPETLARLPPTPGQAPPSGCNGAKSETADKIGKADAAIGPDSRTQPRVLTRCWTHPAKESRSLSRPRKASLARRAASAHPAAIRTTYRTKSSPGPCPQRQADPWQVLPLPLLRRTKPFPDPLSTEARRFPEGAPAATGEPCPRARWSICSPNC